VSIRDTPVPSAGQPVGSRRSDSRVDCPGELPGAVPQDPARPSPIGHAGFAASLRQAGLSILPAITLVSLSVGLILGHQVDAVLVQLDLPGLVLLTVTYAVVMELMPILVGILVAGRAGVALAVRQATLTVTGEMDGLLASGIHPIQFTVGPVLLSMLLMSFAFVVWGTLVTFAAAGAWLWGMAGISPAMFFEALTRALSVGALIEALVKPLLFALLIALIATVNGTGAGGIRRALRALRRGP
jgi:phospholipid/cholesterol/gamma-HCH transport system permease protein